MGGIGLRASIDDGNEIAHGSDVVTDICLLKHGLIQYHQTFTYLYGMDWRAAMNLIDYPHLVEAMNYRAGVLHDNLSWTKQSEFDSVIAWTRNASPDEITAFAADPVGTTAIRRKFLYLVGKL